MRTKFTYDKQGIGIAELAFIALNHSIIFVVISWLIDHRVNVLPIIRKVI